MKTKAIISLAIAIAMFATVFSTVQAGEALSVIGFETTGVHDGASVEAWIPARPLQIVTDRLGAGGQGGTATMYMYNPGNYATNWANGDTDRTMICWMVGNVGYATSVDLTLISGSGFQQKADATMAAMAVPSGVVNGANIDLTWSITDPNVAGVLVYHSLDGSSWSIVGGTTGFVAGQWFSNPCNVERASAWVNSPWTHVGPNTAVDNYYALRYVYAANGVLGIPTNTHGSTGMNNPDGTFVPVYSASTMVPASGGNTEPTVDTATTVPAIHDGNTVSEFVTLTATGSDADADPVTLQYSLDGGAWTTFTSPVQLDFPTPYTEGLHTVEVRAYDGTAYSLANLNADFTITDTTAPLAAWDTVPGATAFWTNDIVFTATYEDFSDYETALVDSFFTYQINGGPVQTLAWVPTFDGFGSYLYTVTATIPAGTGAAGDVITYNGEVTASSATPQTTVLGAGGPITLADPPVLTDPFPVFGAVVLYNGAAGAYTPIAAGAGVPVTVGYFDFAAGAWTTVATVTDASGFYTVDIMNVVVGDPGGIEVAAGPFTGYNNMGYNWVPVVAAYAAGGVQVDVTCGIPYEVVITAPLALSNVIGGTGFLTTYVIYDIDGVIAQGYYTFADGPMIWTSSDPLFVAPANRIFNGIADAGTATDTLTLWTAPQQTIRIGENGLLSNNFPTPWGDFGPMNIGGVSTTVYQDDWDEITLNVMADSFDWNLISMGWNIVSAPMDPIMKGTDATFDAADALAECFAQTADAALVMATRDAAGTYTVNDLSTAEAAAFDIDGVHGYWIYSEVALNTVVTHMALDFDLVANPTANQVTTLAGWNLLGFTHNFGAWTIPTASDFCDGTIGPGLGAATKIVATTWDYTAQWYYSYVVTPTFVMPSRDWVWDFSYSAMPGNGFYLWTEAPIAITFNVAY